MTTNKIFCRGCGMLLSKGRGKVFNMIAEKIYGDKPATEEPPVEFEDGLFCSNCAKIRSKMWRVKKEEDENGDGNV